MKLRSALPLLAVFAVFAAGCSGNGGSDGARMVMGESEVVHEGHSAQTYALLDASGKVTEAGITVPYEAIETPPGEGHDHQTRDVGPAGSFISIQWPEQVQDQTFFDHFEMHWNPMGHPPEAW
ncbi:hypothetical protein EON81_28130, partial [bacterium]